MVVVATTTAVVAAITYLVGRHFLVPEVRGGIDEDKAQGEPRRAHTRVPEDGE